jgi:hypothetical protein
MLARANQQIEEKLGAGPAAASGKSEEWWIAPFPIRPELAGEEARQDMMQSAADLIGPLLDLIGKKHLSA